MEVWQNESTEVGNPVQELLVEGNTLSTSTSYTVMHIQQETEYANAWQVRKRRSVSLIIKARSH